MVPPETSNDVSRNFGVQERYVTNAASARKPAIARSRTVLLPSRLLSCPFGGGGASPAVPGITTRYTRIATRPAAGITRNEVFQA